MSEPAAGTERSPAPRYDFAFEISEADLVNFLRLMQRGVNLIGFGLGLATIAVGVFISVQGSVALGVFGVLVGVAIVLVSQTSYIDTRRVRRGGESIIGTKARYRIGDAGIDIEAGRSANHVDWSVLSHVRANDRVVILMNGARARGWIPTSSIGSAAEREQLLSYVKARIDEAAPDADAAKGSKPPA